MTDWELRAGHHEIIRVLDNWVVVLFDPTDLDKTDLELKTKGKKRASENQYAFDYVFDEEATQE